MPTPLARGPWDPRALHGAAPSALFAQACEHHDPGPAGFIARLTVELMRPVPLAPLELKVRTLRPGKKVQWIEAMLFDERDREVAHATALRMRVDEVDTAGSVHPPVVQTTGSWACPTGHELFFLQERGRILGTRTTCDWCGAPGPSRVPRSRGSACGVR